MTIICCISIFIEFEPCLVKGYLIPDKQIPSNIHTIRCIQDTKNEYLLYDITCNEIQLAKGIYYINENY